MKDFGYRQTLLGCTLRYLNILFIWYFARSNHLPLYAPPILVCSSTALALNAMVHLYVYLSKRHMGASYLMYVADVVTISVAIYYSGFLTSPFMVVLPLTFYSIYFSGFSKRAAITLGLLAVGLLAVLFVVWSANDGVTAAWSFREYPVFAIVAFIVQMIALSGFVYLAILPDPFVTELHKQEHLLATQQRDAELGASLGVIAHELRTPLTIAGGRLEMLDVPIARLPGAEGVKAARYLDDARAELKRIASQIEGVLDYARKRQGQYHFQPTAIGALLNRSAEFFTLKYGRHRTHLAVGHPEPNGQTIVCDHDAIFQVIVNLLNNAVQAKDESRRLTLALTPRVVGPDALIDVTDNGRGIPPEQLDRVFERDFSGREGGSGIGLFVSRQIVSDHGGGLTLTSVVGLGTTVTIRLPLAGPPAAPVLANGAVHAEPPAVAPPGAPASKRRATRRRAR